MEIIVSKMKMTNLSYDVLFEIMIYLSYNDTKNLILTHKLCYNISIDKYFWYNKYLYDVAIKYIGINLIPALKSILPYEKICDYKEYFQLKGHNNNLFMDCD